MSDQRGYRRTRVLKSAKISLGGGAIFWAVRNVGVSRPQLAVESPHGIPTEFTSVILQMACRALSGHLAVRQSDRGRFAGRAP